MEKIKTLGDIHIFCEELMVKFIELPKNFMPCVILDRKDFFAIEKEFMSMHSSVSLLRLQPEIDFITYQYINFKVLIKKED